MTTKKTQRLLQTLAFFIKYGSWSTYNTRDGITSKDVKELESLGFLELNQFNQAKYTGKVFLKENTVKGI